MSTVMEAHSMHAEEQEMPAVPVEDAGRCAGCGRAAAAARLLPVPVEGRKAWVCVECFMNMSLQPGRRGTHHTAQAVQPTREDTMRMRVPRFAVSVGAALLMSAFAGIASAANLDARITFSASNCAVGKGVKVYLTVTNNGGADITNVVPLISVSGAAVLTAPTPVTSTGLIPGEVVTYVLTASPTGGPGPLLFSGYAIGDGGEVSNVSAGTVTVPMPALTSQLSTKIGLVATVSAGVGTPLLFTVTNSGGAPVSNLKAIAWSASYFGGSSTIWGGVGPQPATVTTAVAAGAKNVFSWTFTPTADQVGTSIVFTASSTGDSGTFTGQVSVTLFVQTAPAITAQFVATSQTVAGGPFLVVLTASNSGQATASIAITTTQFKVSGSGTTASVFVGATAVTANIVAGGTFIYTWTGTAKTIGTGMKISNSIYITDFNSGVAMTRVWAESNPVRVLGLAGLSSTLMVCRLSPVVGQPVQVKLNVTNNGGTTALDISGTLLLDGLGIGGVSTPVSIAELAPGAVATLTWTYAPQDGRELILYADAGGFTQSSTGLVRIEAARVSAVLPGIQTIEAKQTWAFPSPARDATRFAYLMAEPGTVTVRVYNAAGTLVATVEETAPAGVQSSGLTTAGLAPGVYYYTLIRKYDSGSSDKADLAKFVVVH